VLYVLQLVPWKILFSFFKVVEDSSPPILSFLYIVIPIFVCFIVSLGHYLKLLLTELLRVSASDTMNRLDSS